MEPDPLLLSLELAKVTAGPARTFGRRSCYKIIALSLTLEFACSTHLTYRFLCLTILIMMVGTLLTATTQGAETGLCSVADLVAPMLG